MRRRLTTILMGVVGLGVPTLMAWFLHREQAEADRLAPAPASTPGVNAPVAEAPGSGGADGGHVRELHPTGMFAALGRFDYRFRRWLPIVGLLIVVGVSIGSATLGGKLIQGGWVIGGSEEQQYAALVADRFGPQDTTMLVVYRDPAGNAASEAFQATVRDSLSAVATDPVVDKVQTYADAPVDTLLSTDGTMTMAVVYLNKGVEASVADAARLADEVKRPAGVDTYVTGVPEVYHEYNQKIESDLVRAEVISLPVALLILMVVFGTLVASVLPLVIAGLALVTTFGVVSLLAGVTEMSIFVNNLSTMIGLALAIDYSLFMVSRYREELRHHTVEVAIERMMGSVGKAVAVSGIAVAIGLSSLTVFGAAALRSMGIAGIVTVTSTLIFGLTVLPALLALLGTRVNRLRVPLPAFIRRVEVDPEVADRRQGHGAWGWIAARVMRRPFVIGLPALGVLLLAGSPFLSISLGTGQNLADLPPMPARTGFELIVKNFPGGESDPITVAVTWPGEDLAQQFPADQLSALNDYVDRLRRLDNVDSVESVLVPPTPEMEVSTYQQLLETPANQRPAQLAGGLNAYLAQWIGGDTTKIQVFTGKLPDSQDGRDLVAAVRGEPGPTGAEVLTGGLPSRSADFMSSFMSSAPIAILIVVLVTGGVLFLTFGSVFLPLKAVLMSLISISASFGALVWIFQDGNLSGVLGFEPSGALGAWLPIIMFAILFGLSMDYEVLLLSRIRERWLATGDNTRAVGEGLGLTGGIITGAALIMVVVFAAFALSSITFIKALGFTMALAVLIDATIVRGLLVPAFMRVMGRANWWAPRWTQRAISVFGLYEGPGQRDSSRGGATA